MIDDQGEGAEPDEKQLKEVDQALVVLRDRRRIQSELTTKLNDVIQSYSCSSEALALRLPVYTDDHRRKLVLGLLEAALSWSADEAEMQMCLSEARKRSLKKMTLVDVLKKQRAHA